MLATLANTNLFEQIEVDDRSSNNSKSSNQVKTIGKQTKVPTPLKAKKSLKRHSTETPDMDVDPVSKKPKIFEQSKEIVDTDDDDER